MTRVKICGITNIDDAIDSVAFGADALGFNFYQKSPRYILPARAFEIIEKLPQKVQKIGVFVNAERDEILEVAETANLDAIQLHGDETPDFAKSLKVASGLEIIKALRVSKDFEPASVLDFKVDAILLDAYSKAEYGGTGETFDWEIARRVKNMFPKMYLAGGLTPDNVVRAISQIKPWAVDACSGIEKEKGVKDRAELREFLEKINDKRN